MLLKKLQLKQLINPPPWLIKTTHYLCQMGSTAYGVAGDDSDSDIYGFCIPPKEMIFPHLKGEIFGFGRQTKRFEQWQEHHIKDLSNKKEYDFGIYNIVKFFQLCMDNNPNMVDSLFVPEHCILHCNTIGNIVRENRKLFLHKGSWHRFRGYAYSMLHKMSIKTPAPGSKREKSIKKYGFDIKFAYHIVRLMYEVEEILTTGDLHLDQNSETLKAIRRGEWSQERVEKFFEQKEHALNEAYEKSTIPHRPNEELIKQVLLKCLEHHFGSLDKCVINQDKYKKALTEIEHICSSIT
jgi:predicted nucleotidyltransferase